LNENYSYPLDLGQQFYYQPHLFFNENQIYYDTRHSYRASTGKLIVSVYEMNTDKPIKGAKVFIRRKIKGIKILIQYQPKTLVSQVPFLYQRLLKSIHRILQDLNLIQNMSLQSKHLTMVLK